jgi:hypothetical protein
MPLLLTKAGLLFAALSPSMRAIQREYMANNAEEAPPHLFGLYLGIALCVLLVLVISLAIRAHGRRQIRKTAVLPEDPFAVDAMRACVSLFCGLDPAWKNRDRRALGRLVTPSVMGGWRARLGGSPASELLVDGPLAFEYMGAANPSPGADRRAVVRVEGRLQPPSKQVSISTTQRKWLLGLAGVILIAAFVGVALAPATKIKNSPPTTITVRQGVPLGGTHLLTYKQGAVINLTVTGHVTDEVHFHGYDIHKDISPGHPVHFRIRATIQGSYPVELEQHAETLAQVTVEP